MHDSDSGFLERRALLAASGLALLPNFPPPVEAASASAIPADAPDLRDPWMDDPQRQLENFARSQGDISGKVTPLWWRGGFLAIFADRQPEVLFRLEACEMKRVRQLADDEFEFQIRLFTCFKDPDTDAMINGRPWRNPLTGERIVVRPNSAAFARVVRLGAGGIVEIDPATGHEAPVHLYWTARGPYMMYNAHREYPDNRPEAAAPFSRSIQYMTAFHDRAAAADFSAPRLEMQFNSTHVGPFLSWMKMPPGAGVSVWHASGHKVRSMSDLPVSYLEQLAEYAPELQEWPVDD